MSRPAGGPDVGGGSPCWFSGGGLLASEPDGAGPGAVEVGGDGAGDPDWGGSALLGGGGGGEGGGPDDGWPGVVPEPSGLAVAGAELDCSSAPPLLVGPVGVRCGGSATVGDAEGALLIGVAPVVGVVLRLTTGGVVVEGRGGTDPGCEACLSVVGEVFGGAGAGVVVSGDPASFKAVLGVAGVVWPLCEAPEAGLEAASGACAGDEAPGAGSSARATRPKMGT